MKRFDQWWLPDCEDHLQEWMTKMKQAVPGGRLGYQYHKYERAIRWVKRHRVAVDIGAHIGLWSWPMAHHFETVKAFEPMTDHCECWRENMIGAPGDVALYGCALGNKDDESVRIKIRPPGSPGDNGTDEKAERSTLRAAIHDSDDGELVNACTLDSFGFDNVDFIKIDCEGYELFVLEGARETIMRCKPCIIVEQKLETGGAERYGTGEVDAVLFLEKLGARRRDSVQGDYILSFGG